MDVNNRSKVSRDKKRLIELRESLIRLVALFGIAILGFWIPAIPAGMTTYVDIYAAVTNPFAQFWQNNKACYMIINNPQ